MKERTKKNADDRIATRIDSNSRKRIGAIATRFGITESDVVRLAINQSLPSLESGKITAIAA